MEQDKRLEQIAKACIELGWYMAVEDPQAVLDFIDGKSGSRMVPGIVIGPIDYISRFAPDVILYDPELACIVSRAEMGVV